MMQGIYTASLGIMSQQKRIDTIANNLANVDTNGYKSVRADFKDAMYQTMQRPVAPQDDLNMEKGHGTLVSGYVRSFSTGFLTETGDELDCYLNGDNAFFTVRSENGAVAYTKEGRFKKSVEADGTYLTTQSGYYVLDSVGQRIRLPEEGNISINSTGAISNVVTTTGEDGKEVLTQTPVAQLGIASFPNKEGLEVISGNLFAQSAASGEPQVAAEQDYAVEQGIYEGSNVNLADEFSRLIRSTRMLQFSSRALSTADQMDETAISTRR